jgi:Polyketide cyclase / dehydrase and lipid transport
MSSPQVFEQSIQVSASATAVEKCITDPQLMHRWLNPALRCEPVGEWSTDLGGKSRFIIQIPLLQPTLDSVVIERKPGLIVWEFSGFFRGRDRWECLPTENGTSLVNRFEFQIPNAIVRYGFNTFAIDWTKQDMQAQLRRLKRVAEQEYLKTALS